MCSNAGWRMNVKNAIVNERDGLRAPRNEDGFNDYKRVKDLYFTVSQTIHFTELISP